AGEERDKHGERPRRFAWRQETAHHITMQHMLLTSDNSVDV
ncbi:unnamed protein product, partial [Urochloa humidicola]